MAGDIGLALASAASSHRGCADAHRAHPGGAHEPCFALASGRWARRGLDGWRAGGLPQLQLVLEIGTSAELPMGAA